MGHLFEDNESKVFLIVDNLKMHHAKVVSAWFCERKACKEDLLSKVEAFMKSLRLLPERVKSYFQFARVRYTQVSFI
jgi:hypothetical protein